VTQISVVIVDDHPLYRDGIARALAEDPRFELVGNVGLGAEGLDLVRTLLPDVALVDLQLPDLDGISLVESVVKEDLATKVAIVSAFEDSATVYRALASGARAYLPKAMSGSEICQAVAAVAAGETVIPPVLQTGVADEIRSRRERDVTPVLTSRELDVLRLASEGKTAHQIADELFVSIATVKSHLQHTYEKLNVTDRASAVAAALRRGLLS
jgi:two-component system nitrate/nitrite response regulator NarL